IVSGPMRLKHTIVASDQVIFHADLAGVRDAAGACHEANEAIGSVSLHPRIGIIIEGSFVSCTQMRNPTLALLRVSQLLIILILLLGEQASAAPIPHGNVDLVAENQWIAPGHQTYFGLNFRLDKGW